MKEIKSRRGNSMRGTSILIDDRNECIYILKKNTKHMLVIKVKIITFEPLENT